MELATRIGLHYTFVSKVERGVSDLRFSNILRIASGLEVDPSELLVGLEWRDY